MKLYRAFEYEHDLSPETNRFRKALWVAIGWPSLLLVALAVLFGLQISSLLRVAKLSDCHQQVVTDATSLQKTILDMETGARGYHLTRRASFLEPYQLGLTEYQPLIDSLRKRVDDEPLIKEKLQLIEAQFAPWLELQQSMITGSSSGNYNIADGERAKVMMDKIRALLDSIIHHEEDLYHNLANRTASQAHATIFWGIVIAVIFVGLSALNVKQQMRRLFNAFEKHLQEAVVAQKNLIELNDALEEKVDQRTADLQNINKELESFCYSVSHDLRAPLRGIDGFSLALLEDYGAKLDPTAQSYLNFIREGIQRMGELIDDLLRLSRFNRVELTIEEFDLTETMLKVFQQLTAQEKNRNIRFTVTGEKVKMIRADRGLMRVVAENLLANAIKYTSREQKAEIEFGNELLTGQVIYYVRDNGVGFDMNFYGKLFGVFQRLHAASEFSGNGIGLATVKKIIERHGGEIWAQSIPRMNTTFYFRLPQVAVFEGRSVETRENYSFS